MTPMYILLVAWGILTGILVILWIYKSTLTMHEDDSIFLNESESQMHKDQVEVLALQRRSQQPFVAQAHAGGAGEVLFLLGVVRHVR